MTSSRSLFLGVDENGPRTSTLLAPPAPLSLVVQDGVISSRILLWPQDVLLAVLDFLPMLEKLQELSHLSRQFPVASSWFREDHINLLGAEGSSVFARLSERSTLLALVAGVRSLRFAAIHENASDGRWDSRIANNFERKVLESLITRSMFTSLRALDLTMPADMATHGIRHREGLTSEHPRYQQRRREILYLLFPDSDAYPLLHTLNLSLLQELLPPRFGPLRHLVSLRSLTLAHSEVSTTDIRLLCSLSLTELDLSAARIRRTTPNFRMTRWPQPVDGCYQHLAYTASAPHSPNALGR